MTVRQKIATNKVLESRGKKAVSKAMLEAGFSPATAKNPKNLTNSKGWKEIMDQFLPDSTLTRKHKQLIETSIIGHRYFPLAVKESQIKQLLKAANCTLKIMLKTSTTREVWFVAPDSNALEKGLQLAYKIKNKLEAETIGPVTNVQINFKRTEK